MMIAKLMVQGSPLPSGATLLGYIDRHPIRGGLGYAVLRFDRTGIEVAWDGVAVIGLPRRWRDDVTFEAAQ